MLKKIKRNKHREVLPVHLIQKQDRKRKQIDMYKGLFGEKIEIEWNRDLNLEGLGMELES